MSESHNLAEDPEVGRKIPNDVQREVRQRCGFGCVICGLPLYEYEHMLEWAKVKRHVADEITLLCDRHHREKTGGLLPLAAVVAANARPFNLQEGQSTPYTLHYSGSDCVVHLGANTFTVADEGYGTAVAAIRIDGVPMIGFILAEGQLLLNLVLFDENNSIALRIRNNELVYSVSPWDIKLTGRTLEIREALGKFFVKLKLMYRTTSL